MKAYYNEFDPKAAAWLRQLIINGDITPGEVDERSITEIEASDLIGFDRVHFFAGIGTWDYCLNQSLWGDRPVWTASLPCQPFSAAGKGLGKEDERHFLPHFLELVKECKPHRVFGEQVERAIAHGWLDDLQATMEAEGYAVGHCVLGAHSVNAPHIRQRLYWVVDRYEQGPQRRSRAERSDKFAIGTNCMVNWVADTQGSGLEALPSKRGEQPSGLHDTESQRRYIYNSENVRPPNGKGHSLANSSDRIDEQSSVMRTPEIDWIYCRDNKYRPVKPGIQPLVDGVAADMVCGSDSSPQINANATQEARAMRLKGYGNAIQAQTAIAFINAYMSI